MYNLERKLRSWVPFPAQRREPWKIKYFSSSFYCCDKDHDQKQPGEKRVCLVFFIHNPQKEAKVGTQARNPETRTEAKAVREHS